MQVKIEHGIEGAETAVSRQDSIIIVDTIRASTTYVNAFSSGAVRIVPCSSQKHLDEMMTNYPSALKSGERLCKKIEGYDLGSSPEEMSQTDLKGKIILSSTTNGSRMVVASSKSPLVVMGSFCNSSAVVKFVKKQGRNVSIICSGRLGKKVVEDTLCAEYLQYKFNDKSNQFRLTSTEISSECKKSPSYEMLASAGLEKDFEYCMKIDSHELIPVLDGDGFILL